MAKKSLFRLSMRNFIYVFIVVFFFMFIISYQYLQEEEDDSIDYPVDDEDIKVKGSDLGVLQQVHHPIILWWTPFTGERGKTKTCGGNQCFFTIDKRYKDHSKAKVFMFYGTDFQLNDLPLPRLRHHQWGLLHEESPKNVYLFSHAEAMSLFNHTSTFRRESDFPITTQYLSNLEEIQDKRYMRSVKEKTQLRHDEGLALLNYVQTDCNAPSDRDHLVTMLQQSLSVDSYGACLHNKELPESLRDPLKGMDNSDFYYLLAKYKFVLAFENGVCDDYITEKFWRPFITGSVPIIFGSPKIKDFLHPQSAIIVDDYASVDELVKHIKYLDDNDEEYEKYLSWKHSGISNIFLKQIMEKREWGVNDWMKPNMIDSFECFVCKRVHDNIARASHGESQRKFIASVDHYGCPIPKRFSDKPVGNLHRVDDTWWAQEWITTKFQAQALNELVNQGINFTEVAVINKASLLQFKRDY